MKPTVRGLCYLHRYEIVWYFRDGIRADPGWVVKEDTTYKWGQKARPSPGATGEGISDAAVNDATRARVVGGILRGMPGEQVAVLQAIYAPETGTEEWPTNWVDRRVRDLRKVEVIRPMTEPEKQSLLPRVFAQHVRDAIGYAWRNWSARARNPRHRRQPKITPLERWVKPDYVLREVWRQPIEESRATVRKPIDWHYHVIQRFRGVKPGSLEAPNEKPWPSWAIPSGLQLVLRSDGWMVPVPEGEEPKRVPQDAHILYPDGRLTLPDGVTPESEPGLVGLRDQELQQTRAALDVAARAYEAGRIAGLKEAVAGAGDAGYQDALAELERHEDAMIGRRAEHRVSFAEWAEMSGSTRGNVTKAADDGRLTFRHDRAGGGRNIVIDDEDRKDFPDQ